MSDYPSAPHYGANYGGQNQQYIPPAYPNQYSQPDDGQMGQNNYAQNYDANMSAYGYNGAIPGFSAANLAAGAPPLPIYHGWSQDPNPIPPYSAPQNTLLHTGYPPNSYNNYQQHYPPVPQHPYQQSMPTPAKPYDEGEVSEGEFDGGYAPPNPTTVDYGANQYSGNGFLDTAHRPVYARNQDPPSMPISRPGNEYLYAREPVQVIRQESGSYSPYAVASRDEDREVRHVQKQNHNTSTPKQLSEKYSNGAAQKQNRSSWEQNATKSLIRPDSRANGSRDMKRQGSPVVTKLPPTRAPSNPPHAAHPLPVEEVAHKTVLPAAPAQPLTPLNPIVYDRIGLRKKAEAAILNLLPHDIRYEKYVEEGIAGDIIGSLFDDLRVPRTSSKASADADMSHKINGGQAARQDGPGQSSTAKSTAQASRLEEKIETKPLAAPTPKRAIDSIPLAGISASPPSTNSNLAKSAAASEKERTLQMKMEALRKSREERAQKAAAKNNAKLPGATSVAPTSRPEKPTATPAHVVATQPSNLSTSPLPAPLQPQIQIVTSQTPSRTLPIQRSIPTPQPQAIPGLFLASAGASSTPPTFTNGTVLGSQSGTRKRPVAADFDTPTTAAPYRRPFGHSHSGTPLVIDVSEDDNDSDDEDVAMDLDSQADQDSPVQPPKTISDQRNVSIQNLPALTNFPARKPFTPPPVSSAASTPPVFPPSRKGTLGRPEVLQEKEMQIEELRRKIAEAEAAKAQKKAKQSVSGTQTPRPMETIDMTSVSPNDSMARKVEASVQMQTMIHIAEEKVETDQKRLVQAQAIEQEKEFELKKQEAERKRLRREKIATDLPRVDAEVLEKQRKLEQLKAQMAEIEADVKKNLADKQRMAEEMDKLGQEAEEQLQAQKDKLKDLTGTQTRDNTTPPRPTPSLAPAAEISPSSGLNTDDPTALQPSSGGLGHPVKEAETAQPEQDLTIPLCDSTPAPADTQYALANSCDSAAEVEPGEIRDNGTADQDLEAALQEAARAEADIHDVRNEDDSMDIEESYAPDPHQLAPESITNPLGGGNRSPSYSPVLERVAPSLSDRQSDVDYEPPDATPRADPYAQSPPFSPAPADPVTTDPNDLVIFEDNTDPIAATDETEIVEDQLVPPPTNGSVPLSSQGASLSDDKTQFYSPYESPLKAFRAFRFHPEFNREVAGGFRSLTYSHKIDPKVELCHWEMAGGACNDKTCEFQHFRNIGLPDDVVLSTLGSPDEFTGEQRKLFCDGLKEVLSDLRARKVRDFDVIAKEVVAHRARFLGDASRVLMLDEKST